MFAKPRCMPLYGYTKMYVFNLFPVDKYSSGKFLIPLNSLRIKLNSVNVQRH